MMCSGRTRQVLDVDSRWPPSSSLLLLLLTVKANQACLLYDSGFLAVADSSSSKQPLIRAWKNLEQVH